MPKIIGVAETALYVENMQKSISFYSSVLEFEAISRGERLSALRIAENQVLLLFKKGMSVKATVTSYGIIPPTDGQGELHLTFGVLGNELPIWRDRLVRNSIELESQVEWPVGGKSVYFRDPDRHLIELKTTDWNSAKEFGE